MFLSFRANHVLCFFLQARGDALRTPAQMRGRQLMKTSYGRNIRRVKPCQKRHCVNIHLLSEIRI